MNPYELAEALGIMIILEDLGAINGYYSQILCLKQIHINHNLSKHMQTFTAAHELGHAILHPNANTPFFKNNTFFVVSKMEKEANSSTRKRYKDEQACKLDVTIDYLMTGKNLIDNRT